MTPRWRLFEKYALLIIALVSLALFVSGSIGLYFSYQQTRAQLFALQREKALAAAGRIEQFIKDIEHQLGWTALPAPEATANALERQRFEYLKLLRQVPAITEAVWLDGSGREQLRVSRIGLDSVGGGTDYSRDARFTETRNGRTYFSPVNFRKETEPYLTISRPAGGDQGGVTVIDVNLKFVWDVISHIKIGQTGLAYVVDSTGTLIAHPDISLVLKKTRLSDLQAVAPRRDAPPDMPLLSHDFAGREVLTAQADIPTLNWNVIVDLPVEEAFAPLYQSLLRSGLLLLGGLVVSIAASLALARHMVRPIRALQAGAQKLGAGELGYRIAVNTGDELEALAQEFNRMGEKLEESYAGLERKVEARTAELKESLEHETATSEILGVIASSPTDVQPVFDIIAERAARLCNAKFCIVFRFDGEWLDVASAFGLVPEGVEFVRQRFPMRPGNQTIGARVVREGIVVHVPDVLADPQYALKDAAQLADFRGALGVPMARQDRIVGAITVMRADAGGFSDKQVKLLQTFASQAIIAIENVRLFNEIEDKSHQLEAANRHKSEFLANMSHELRTPLNAIIGFSDVLRERMFGELNAKQAEYVDDIHASGQHLLSLINDILDLSKIEAGRMGLELSTFDLPLAIGNTLTLVGERAARCGIKLEREIDPRLGSFTGDERKLKQILLNLLSNGIKFTPEGGRILVKAVATAGTVEISVSDSGVGIAPADQEIIFEEFRQVQGGDGRSREGTGLGLTLTRKFVELHGGKIWVRSEPGQGSTFTFTLPEQPCQTPVATS